jgi:replicative DNA helicase
VLDELQAEFALLGAALIDPAVVDLCEIEPDDFLEPTCGRVWATIRSQTAKGRCADLGIVAGLMADDAGVSSLGGMGWLADLFDKAPPAASAPDYAAVVVDRARRRRLLETAGWAQGALKGGAETGEVIDALEAQLLALQRHSRAATVVSAGAAVREMLEALSAADSDAPGVVTGIWPLDEHLGALQPDELILIAGRPGMGKSALAACIALNIARAGLGVIEINSEMSTAQMMRRHVADICHLRRGAAAPTYKDIKRRLVTGPQLAMIQGAAREIADLPLAMVKRTGLTVSSLRSLVRRQVGDWTRRGVALGAITVDHVGLLRADGGGRDRYNDQTEIAIAMKALADELHVPVIALVQLSRKVEDRDSKRPMLGDLRDSGAWEENVDIAIGCFRAAYYAHKEPEPKDDGRHSSAAKWLEWDQARRSTTIEAILMKVREGEEATIPLWASIGHNAIRGENPDPGGLL